MIATRVLVAAGSLAMALPAAAQRLDVPVMMGETDGQAAGCSSGRVARLDPRGDGFLAVRAGPSTDYPKIDELYNGDEVSLCDREGRWFGVVYGGRDCREHDPKPRRTAYRGPCLAGWVFDRYIDPIAG